MGEIPDTIGEMEALVHLDLSKNNLTASTCPHLKSCYKECVQAALDFALSAEDFDELVDPRSLYDHFLGPEPSACILQLILREERKVATRFNQDKYAHAKGKKNEPLELPLPPRTKAKRKEKMGQSVWADPTTAFGRARKVITEDKLKALSSVLLHKLVSFHIHKMLQVLRESLHLTTDYLTTKEKVVMATSKAKAVEAKYSTLRK